MTVVSRKSRLINILSFLTNRMETTNFDLRITKAQAEEILQKKLNVKYGFDIMCKEYGTDNLDCTCGVDACLDCGKERCECGSERYHLTDCEVNDWCGITEEDLDENGKLGDDYQTFEIWK